MAGGASKFPKIDAYNLGTTGTYRFTQRGKRAGGELEQTPGRIDVEETCQVRLHIFRGSFPRPVLKVPVLACANGCAGPTMKVHNRRAERRWRRPDRVHAFQGLEGRSFGPQP
jgi:hypothetical protein